MDLQQIIKPFGLLHIELIERPLQPHAMPVKINQLAAQNTRHLIDAIGHQERPVKDRHLGFILGQVVSIQINCAHIFHPHSSAAGGCTPASSNLSGVSRSSPKSSGPSKSVTAAPCATSVAGAIARLDPIMQPTMMS